MKECASICKRLFRQSYLLLTLASLLYSCGTGKKATNISGKPHHTTTTGHSLRTAEDIVTDLIARGKKLIGKPYRYQGPSPWPMDCSGYVAYLYSCYDIHIPRSSSALYNYTIPICHPLPGDLLFFRGSKNHKGTIGHVALLIEVCDDELIMLHNTNSRGIIIESLQRSSYFSKRYIRAGRLPEIQALMD